MVATGADASELRRRWRGREGFVVLAIGAAGLEMLESLEALWHHDPDRCGRLDAIAIDAPWPSRARLPEAPPATAGLHRIERAGGRVQWLLAQGDGELALRELVASVDHFILSDGAGAPAGPGLLVQRPEAVKALSRLAAPGATLVGQLDDAALIQCLRSSGFVARFEAAPQAPSSGLPSRIAPTAVERPAFHADHAPRHIAQRPPGRSLRTEGRERRVVIVGAGLAGCAAAWAFAQHGWSSSVIERRPGLAAEASGNPAGLFHGIVNGIDGPHARFNRAAALEAEAAVRVALRSHGVAGAHDGLLQLMNEGSDLGAMRALLARLKLPSDFVRALDAAEASALAGIALARAAWWHPRGGWVDPAGLCNSYLERAGASTHVRFGRAVTALRREGDAWILLDAEGRPLDAGASVVLANAGAAFDLIDDGAAWPVQSVRGQISVWHDAARQGIRAPRHPVTGAGYVLPDIGGDLIFGATAIANDGDAAVRESDHRSNLAQLAALSPEFASAGAIDVARLGGRTAWRCVARDRLPIIGAVPALEPASVGAGPPKTASRRSDQPRFVAREPGLFLFTALGSRGISWSALGAQVLASCVTGAPLPIEASLLDAVDPARFRVRAARQAVAAVSRSPAHEPGKAGDPDAV